MLFGKIDYLNLLPFHVFLKRAPLSSYAKKAIEHKKGVPSRLNRDLRVRRIDAAVISSIESRRKIYRTLDFGIVAKRAVKSVLVRKDSKAKFDVASASSNMLARVLSVSGEVIIGDRALKAFLQEGEQNFYDLAKIWHERTGLPFVFARFCYRQNGEIYGRLTRKFLRQKTKIPRYILSHYALTRGVSCEQIRWYLKFISYRLGKKEKKALFIFLNRARRLNASKNV